MNGELSECMRFPIRGSADVESAWQCGMAVALAMGFPLADANKIAVAISELGQNIRRYAERGSITLTTYNGRNRYIEVVAQDKGPGITDVELVLAGGYSTSHGLGRGVSGARELMDEFELHSVAGEGTTIRAIKVLPW